MNYRITGLPLEQFKDLIGRDAAELAARGVERVIADDPSGFPCRVTMAPAAVGESLLLLNYEHQPAATPYRASHAIFVRESARATYVAENEIPEVLRSRPLSVRAFARDHMMVDADLVEGAALESVITPFLARSDVAYLQVHYAKRGCYAARVERA